MFSEQKKGMPIPGFDDVKGRGVSTKQNIRIPLPPPGPAHSCTPLLCKEPKEEVQITGQVTPGSSDKLALLQPPNSSQPCT